MSKKLPVVILWDDVIFPSTSKRFVLERPYNIRACELVLNSINQGGSGCVLVVAVKDFITEDNFTEKSICDVGVLCELVSLTDQDDDGVRKVNVVFKGLKRVKFKDFEINKESPGNFWLSDFVVMKTIPSPSISIKYENNARPLRQLCGNSLQTKDDSLEDIIDKIADSFPSDKPEFVSFKKKILAEANIAIRVRAVLSMKMSESEFFGLGEDDEFVDNDYSDEEISSEIDDQITKKVSKNISRQQKEFYLREKMKVIKEELGDASSKEVEIKKLREQINKGNYPKHVVDKAKEELQRFEMCSSYSNEATVIRAYLD